MAEYIEREAVTAILAHVCCECKEACEEFDGFYADCEQCMVHGIIKATVELPTADVRLVKRGKRIPEPIKDIKYTCSACTGRSNYGCRWRTYDA